MRMGGVLPNNCWEQQEKEYCMGDNLVKFDRRMQLFWGADIAWIDPCHQSPGVICCPIVTGGRRWGGGTMSPGGCQEQWCVV